MSNLTKLIIGLGAVAFLAWLVLMYSLNSRLNEAITRLESAQSRLDSGMTTLTTARTAIDSVRTDLARFSSYLKDIQGRVEILDLNERSGTARFSSQKEIILRRLRDLYKDVETTGAELPEIPVVMKGSL